MTYSSYINDGIFLQRFQSFQKNWLPGNCLLMLDGYSSHSSLMCLNYCRENCIVILCAPSHTTHVLQPLARIGFKPIYTQVSSSRDTKLQVQQSQFCNSKIQFYKTFLRSIVTSTKVGRLSRVLSSQLHILLTLPLSPKTNVCPLRIFYTI